LVGFLVWGIGLSLGGPTGYAINPARDLGPRIAHAILPIPDKGDSEWGYALVPILGPIVGGILGAVAFRFVSSNW
jgi:glycerol uptake facilitator protein